MALTKFVRNFEDLSDDGGYKFRFHCDKCQDGFESQYISASANILKTALDIFSVFNPMGYRAKNAAESIDRGLRGKERDSAYEKAVNEAMVHFKKCTQCGKWVCPENCWNESAGMCEECAPNAQELGASAAAKKRAQKVVEDVQSGIKSEGFGAISCPTCNKSTQGGKFCEHCGNALTSQKFCGKCGAQIGLNAKFCSGCGNKS